MKRHPHEIDPELLVRELDWLRALATQLVGAEGDDLAHDTVASVLTHPPEEIRGMRAFLATIVRRKASNWHRDSARRRDREAAYAARRGADRDPAVVAEEVESQRAIVDAVLALEDHYRDVILLRYFRDLSPPEIGRELDIPIGTVATRLRRAREKVREKLDASFGDRRRWLAVVGTLVAPPRGPRRAIATSVVTVGIVVVLGFALFALPGLWSGSNDTDLARASNSNVAPTRADAEPRTDGPSGDSGDRTAPATDTESSPESTRSDGSEGASSEDTETSPATLRVVDSHGDPLAHARVEIFTDVIDDRFLNINDHVWTFDTDAPAHTVQADAYGEAVLPFLGEGSHRARVRTESGFGRLDFSVRRKEGEPPLVWPTNVLAVTRIRTVEATVTDAGEPVEGCVVILLQAEVDELPPSSESETNCDEYDWGVTGPNGKVVFGIDAYAKETLSHAKRMSLYAVRFGDSPVQVTVAAQGNHVKAAIELPTTVRLRLELPPELNQTAQVLWAPGESFPAGAMSLISWGSGATLASTLGGFTSRWRVEVHSQRTVAGFTPGETYTFVVRSYGHEPFSTTVTLGEQRHQTLALDVGAPNKRNDYATIELDAVDTTGRPLSWSELRHLAFEVRRAGFEPELNLASRTKDGVFRVNVSPGVEGEFVALIKPAWDEEPQPSGAIARVPLPALAAHETTSLALVAPVAPLLVAGRVVSSQSGAGIAGVWPSIDVDGLGYLSALTAGDGRFQIRSYRLRDRDRAEVRGTVKVGDPWHGAPVEFECGENDVTIAVEATGTLIGRIRTSHPELRSRLDVELQRSVLPAVTEPAAAPTTRSSFGFDDDEDDAIETEKVYLRADGAFECRNLVPAIYTLVARIGGIEVLRVPTLHVEPGGELAPASLEDRIVGGDLRWVEVKVLDPSGDPVAGCMVLPCADAEEELPIPSGDRASLTDSNGNARILIGEWEKPQLAVSAWRINDTDLDDAAIVDPVFPLVVTLEED